MTARGGSLYLSPNANGKQTVLRLCGTTGANCTPVQKAVLFVASDGTAYLVNS